MLDETSQSITLTADEMTHLMIAARGSTSLVGPVAAKALDSAANKFQDALAAVGEATPRERCAQPIELDDPEDMANELEEVRVASRVELDAAFESGAEDGEFSPERWRAGKAREAYLEGWNRTNADDQRSL